MAPPEGPAPERPDALEPEIWAQAITHPHGALRRRLTATAAIFDACQRGRPLPRPLWPGGATGRALRRGLRATGALPLAEGDAALANALTESWLAAAQRARHGGAAGPLRRRWRRHAARQRALAALLGRWRPTVSAWRTLHQALGAAAEALGLTPAAAVQLTRDRGWRQLEAASEALRDLGEIRALVASLGRGQRGLGLRAAEGARLPAIEALGRGPVEAATRTTLGAPLGLQRTDDPGRMLPTEAITLLHPRLRLLWHARRAQRGLMAHARSEGAPDQPEAAAVAPEGGDAQPSLGTQGPIIICLDRSGSMHGAPADRARALVIEALKAARRARRACRLIAFAGPGDIRQHTLTLSAEGFRDLLACLALPFTGATDVDGPLALALGQIEGDGDSLWSEADVLLITDGRFTPSAATRQRAARLRASGAARVVGAWIYPPPIPAPPNSLVTVCDEVWQVWSSTDFTASHP